MLWNSNHHFSPDLEFEKFLAKMDQRCSTNTAYISTMSSISVLDSLEDDSCIFFNFFQ